MGGEVLLTRTIQDGQGYKNETNKGSQTRWSHESQRRILLMCGDVNEGASTSRSAEAEGCSCSPHLTEQDLMLLVVSPAKPFKYPLLTLTRRSHRRSPRGTEGRPRGVRSNYSGPRFPISTFRHGQDTKQSSGNESHEPDKQIRTRQQVAAPPPPPPLRQRARHLSAAQVTTKEQHSREE